MTKRMASNEPKCAELSVQQKQSAIEEIDKLIDELSKFDSTTIGNISDDRIYIFQIKINKVLVDIFGPNTLDYERYRNIEYLNTTPITMGSNDIQVIQQGVGAAVKKAVSVLNVIKDGFIRDIQNIDSNKPSRILAAYSGLDLHPAIATVSNDLYKNGHYAQAVEAAAKEIERLVKEKSGMPDKYGSSLMQHVFSSNSPKLKFNSLSSQSDKDEQQGFMYLYTGAVMAIRNPRAHENRIDAPEEALEYIAFISLLAKRLDKAYK